MSAVKQHFRQKHLHDIDDVILTAIIMKKKRLSMPIYIKKDDAPQLRFWQKVGYFLVGLALGGLAMVALQSASCYLDLGTCPPAIHRLINDR